MTTKTYEFSQDVEYTSIGCDCCEPTAWDIYIVEDQRFSDLADALEYILEKNGIVVEVHYKDEND